MKHLVLSIVLLTILTGCGDFEWFPSHSVSISSSILPDAPTGIAYNQNLAASGGTGTRSWSVTGGSLPPGLSLSTEGTISGTPTAATTAAAGTNLYTFTVKVTDSSTSPASATRDLSIFTPTTGRMNDATGKVFGQDLTFDSIRGLALTVTNQDSVAHTIQVVVANYDATGKKVSTFNMTPVTVSAAGSTTATNSIFDTFPVNNWRITNVSTQ